MHLASLSSLLDISPRPELVLSVTREILAHPPPTPQASALPLPSPLLQQGFPSVLSPQTPSGVSRDNCDSLPEGPAFPMFLTLSFTVQNYPHSPSSERTHAIVHTVPKLPSSSKLCLVAIPLAGYVCWAAFDESPGDGYFGCFLV